MSQRKDKLGRGKVVTEEKKAKLRKVAENLGRKVALSMPIVWPGGSAEMELRVLPFDVAQKASSKALAEVQLMVGDNFIPRNEAGEALAAARAKHIVARACFVPETEELFFDSPDELGSIATEMEIYAVYKRYEDHKEDTDPDLHELSEEDLNIATGGKSKGKHNEEQADAICGKQAKGTIASGCKPQAIRRARSQR
jgi:hypothetical protein